MSIGKKIADGRKRKNLSQTELAKKEGVNYSRSAIAQGELGHRNIPKHAYAGIAGAIDDPQTYFDFWEESTGQVSIPFLDGPMIMRQAAAMSQLVKKETCEAMEHVEEYCWFKPPELREKEDVDRIITELLDSAASMINLVAVLCEESDMSMKRSYGQWRVSLKARKYEA